METNTFEKIFGTVTVTVRKYQKQEHLISAIFYEKILNGSQKID